MGNWSTGKLVREIYPRNREIENPHIAQHAQETNRDSKGSGGRFNIKGTFTS